MGFFIKKQKNKKTKKGGKGKFFLLYIRDKN